MMMTTRIPPQQRSSSGLAAAAAFAGRRRPPQPRRHVAAPPPGAATAAGAFSWGPPPRGDPEEHQNSDSNATSSVPPPPPPHHNDAASRENAASPPPPPAAGRAHTTAPRLAGLRWQLRAIGNRLASGEVRAAVEASQLVASLVFIVLYVWSTYVPEPPGSWRYWLDFGLCCVFAVDYLYRITAGSGGRHPLQAALRPLNVIDLLSFAPSLLGGGQWLAGMGLDLRWFRIFRALRLLRLSLLEGNLPHMKLSRGALLAGAVNVPLMSLIASVLAWLFTSAALVQVIERMPWHDALYFVTTTLTTVGYGDVVVRSTLGRAAMMVMMLVGIVLIPVRASQLYSRLSERRSVAGPAPGSRRPFVIISGRLSDVRGFNDLFSSVFLQVQQDGCERWRRLQMVALTDDAARPEFLALQELHERRLTLIEGSALWEPDLLGQARLPLAEAALVLADRFSSDARAEDTDVQFRVWAMKSAVRSVPLYVQVLQLSSVATIAPFLDPSRDVITSLEHTRHRLVALNCLAPGASTLVTNLLRCTGAAPPRNRPLLAGRKWLREYVDGCHRSLHAAPAGPSFDGVPFWRVAEAAHAETGALLIGVLAAPRGQLRINPLNWVVREGQPLVWVAASEAAAAAAARGGPWVAARLGAQAGVAAKAGERLSRAAAAAAVAAAATAQPAGASNASSGTSTGGIHMPSANAAQPHTSSTPTTNGSSSNVTSVTSDTSDADNSLAVLRAQRQLLEATLAAAHGGSLESQDAPILSPQWSFEESDDYSTATNAPPHTASSAYSYSTSSPPTTTISNNASSGAYSSPSTNSTTAALAAAAVAAQAAAQAAAAAAAQPPPPPPACLAPWSAAFEADSFDEAQLCTDSEIADSSLLMRSWAAARAEAAAVGGPVGGGIMPGSSSSSGGGNGNGGSAPNGGSNGESGGGTRQLRQQQQQQQSAQGPLFAHQRRARADCSGHVIICGCERSFLAFARQLRASCGARGAPPIVVLHPTPPPALLDALGSALGRSVLHIPGRPSDSASLEAAGARRALSLAYLSPPERPSARGGSKGDGEGAQSITSRAAVLADSEALAACYGVGEEVLPGMMNTVVELGFTSSIRFLQPGLLLHGRAPPPHAQPPTPAAAAAAELQHEATAAVGCGLGPPASGAGPAGAARVPRTSWRHQKQVEEEALAEGLTEWQVNAYYAAGRVLVPALLDVFTAQAFFRWRQLPDLLQELAGDDGRPGGAALHQIPVPLAFVGRTYGELVSALLLVGGESHLSQSAGTAATAPAAAAAANGAAGSGGLAEEGNGAEWNGRGQQPQQSPPPCRACGRMRCPLAFCD